MKTKTIRQTGIVIQGIATLNLWGGGQGEIYMKEKVIPYKKITKENILRCVNDAGFGCESIEEAQIEIYIDYDCGFAKEWNRTIIATLPWYNQFYNRG